MDHRTELEIDGSSVTTLADIVPPRGPLRVLFVGKTPSPASVEVGHYFMGRMGKGLWKRLDEALAQHTVHWHWVKGHAGHAQNERADELAREGLIAARAGAKGAMSK